VYAITAIFGLPLLIAGAMIDPQGLHLRGLITYTAIMLVLMPFAGGWQLLVTQLVVPTAGRSRVGAVLTCGLVAHCSGRCDFVHRLRIELPPTGHRHRRERSPANPVHAASRTSDRYVCALLARIDRLLGRGFTNTPATGRNFRCANQRMRALRDRLRRRLALARYMSQPFAGRTAQPVRCTPFVLSVVRWRLFALRRRNVYAD
jgi:hypothetical protein